LTPATTPEEGVVSVRITAVVLGLLAVLAVYPNPASAAATCQNVTVPVALGSGLPVDRLVAGTLCEPASYAGRPRRVDVMVHGGTYSRSYWDFPTNYPQYSYVRRTLGERRATFAYDRLGAGLSSRPLSEQAGAAAEAFVLHQVVVWLRTEHGFPIVDVVGHSFGSMVAVAEAGAFQDVDALVLTGYLHASGPGDLHVTDLVPAATDPRFAGQGYDLGWMTSRPGGRGPLFYSASADPAVIATDEATKDVVSSTFFGEEMTALEVAAPLNVSDAVRAPVLLVAGQLDAIYCGITLDCTDTAAVRAHEEPYFLAAPSLTVVMVPDTGHDVALHPSAAQSFTDIDQWLDAIG
jgi:pimeloyl-ACP methyl ester carboxylesterase